MGETSGIRKWFPEEEYFELREIALLLADCHKAGKCAYCKHSLHDICGVNIEQKIERLGQL